MFIILRLKRGGDMRTGAWSMSTNAVALYLSTRRSKLASQHKPKRIWLLGIAGLRPAGSIIESQHYRLGPCLPSPATTCIQRVPTCIVLSCTTRPERRLLCLQALSQIGVSGTQRKGLCLRKHCQVRECRIESAMAVKNITEVSNSLRHDGSCHVTA